MDAAREIVRERGTSGLSLREVARRAGVSPGAPYHHFKDKAALIAALALESLLTLDGLSEEAIKHKRSPQKKLEALGLAYVSYAAEHPNEFKLMFGAEHEPLMAQDDPASAPVFRVLLKVVSEFDMKEAQHLSAAIAAWSLVHGLALLLTEGPLAPLVRDTAQDKARLEQLTKAVTSKLVL